MKERRQKLEEITKVLAEGTREVFTSGRYEAFLKVMARFHTYSANNILLIALQKPDATLIAGFSAWRDKFHRQVLQGSRGIRILAPSPYKVKVEEDGREKEVIVPAYRPAYVFDISQTKGEPLPEIAQDLSGQVKDYEKLLQVLIRAAGVPVAFEEMGGGVKGYFSPAAEKIALKKDMPQLQTVKTLIHEISHARLHSRQRMDELKKEGHVPDAREKEVQAESVAYVVCSFLGLDTSQYSFGYIAGWSGDKDVPQLTASLSAIRDTANDLLARIGEEAEKVREAGKVSIVDRLSQMSRECPARGKTERGKHETEL